MAPLPSWKNLVHAFLRSPADDQELAQPWLRSVEKGYWFSRTAWSLYTVVRWYQLANKKKSVTVWIPDFFCNTSLQPLRDLGVKFVFYPVMPNMELDITVCEKLAETEPMDLLLLVHYFGKPIPTTQATKLAKQNNAWLVEDAAHVLKPIEGIGQVGDCVLYSPHKTLPIPDGAVLVVRENGTAKLGEHDAIMELLPSVLDQVYKESSCTTKQYLIWTLKRVAQKLGVRGKSTFTISHVLSERDSDAVVSNCHKMSHLSKRLISGIAPALNDIAKIRTENSRFWRALLTHKLKGVLPLDLGDTSVPYLSPFQIITASESDAIETYLKDRHLPVCTWPDLPPEVLKNSERHSVAIELRKNRLYFSVHHSIPERALTRLWKNETSFNPVSWSCEPVDQEVWGQYWKQCNQTNMLQSWQYGDAKQGAEGWTPRRFLICDEQSTPVALVQILEKSLPILGGVARLNRGPLVLKTVPESQSGYVKIMSLCLLKKQAQKQRWWLFQVAPEINKTAFAKYSMISIGYKDLGRIAWGSGRIDLRVDENEILMSFAGKWRNTMRKGIKLGVMSEHVDACDGVQYLLKNYAELQDSRGFSGLSDSLIRELAKQQGELWKFTMLIAKQQSTNEDLGVLVSIRAGDTATYLIGYANENGRKLQANSVLLWHAILQAKNEGCTWFDIGGLNVSTPKGIADFKKGLNSHPYTLYGEWRA